MPLRLVLFVVFGLVAALGVLVVARSDPGGGTVATQAAACPGNQPLRGRASQADVRLAQARLRSNGAISLVVDRGGLRRQLNILSERCAAQAGPQARSALLARRAFAAQCGLVGRSGVPLRGSAKVRTAGSTIVGFDTMSCAGAPTAQLLAAGDIAACDEEGDDATGRMLRGLPGLVATLGDTAYHDGTAADFSECYHPAWGHAKWRTRPVPGNHEYHTEDASGYFGYFGAGARPPRGYYSYDLGRWHLIALNSNCSAIGGCDRGSAQERWLREDLRRNRRARCTLAYWHHPRFSSGAHHGNTDAMEPFWQALYAARADVVLSGHDHNYERFAPQTPKGARAPGRGIREFVVGTGGVGTRPRFDRPLSATEVRNSDTLGLLKLTLKPNGYDWEFIPAPGHGSFTDRGSGTCH